MTASVPTRYPTTPVALLAGLVRHRHVLWQLARRDVLSRYRGTALGVVWSVLNPLLMLAMYTFVFSVVFKARWPSAGGAEGGAGTFALAVFCGLTLHAPLAEILTRAPMLMLAQVNFVKKVVFPLEILPVSAVMSAGFHFLVSLLILTVGGAALTGLHLPLLALPAILLPFFLLLLGLAWGLSALGVFVRDIGQTMGLFATVLLFLSPVFFPVSSLPEFLRPWAALSPLTIPVESLRAVLLEGRWPDFAALGAYLLAAVGVTVVGFWFFQRTRKGFADVL